ncbi:MAG: ornithine carbamoyltransferase [Nanoarchaeota archaeon]|nr:ornithine carbamoyltransferase [Nanoarchaeota archaeon]
MNSLLTMLDLSKNDIFELLELAEDMKKNKLKYSKTMKFKTLLMIFEKPSLRTRVSFQVAMSSLGGSSVVVETQHLPLISKESIEDTARVSSRYVDIIMARLFDHNELEKLGAYSTVPVINGLTNSHHPIQIISDLLTIKEKKGSFAGLKVCYLGDGMNNVTHSLIQGCAILGIDIFVATPKELGPDPEIVMAAKNISSGKIIISDNPLEAAKDADVIYTDTWMSYHTPETEKDKRMSLLKRYQVNASIVKHAKPDYIFMNCLPAMNGYEQTEEVFESANSAVFDQAENRLHMQKAVLLKVKK